MLFTETPFAFLKPLEMVISSKVFKGILQAAGTDHIILKDVASETRYLLLTIYLCYVTFDEKIEYEYPYRNK